VRRGFVHALEFLKQELGVFRKEDAIVKGPPTISSVTYTLARVTGSVACKNNGLLCDHNDRKHIILLLLLILSLPYFGLHNKSKPSNLVGKVREKEHTWHSPCQFLISNRKMIPGSQLGHDSLSLRFIPALTS
jgi:hypothetical protein